MSPEFFAQQNLNFDQVKALTHALLAVARADGVHDSEMRMIREFYESCARVGDPPLSELASGPFDVQAAKPHFNTPELQKLFVKSLILLGYADGTYAKVEDSLIREYAQGLGLAAEEVDQLHEATRDYLLSSLAHVENVEALRVVSRELKPS